MKQTLFMETTKIDCAKTISQIQTVLGKNGASAILTEYVGQEVAALSFQVVVGGNAIPFRLPCRYEAIFRLLHNKNPYANKENMIAQAKRIAWRQILRWVEAQMALVSTSMVKLEEVFLPYMQTGKKGETVFQIIENQKFKMLEDKTK